MTDEGSWADESDWELGAEDVAEAIEEAAAAPPVVAVVGRPNVGKSTLVNRILGRREAVVQDVPGVTRDRVSYDALWLGRRFVVQDTGGWEPDAKGLQQLGGRAGVGGDAHRGRDHLRRRCDGRGDDGRRGRGAVVAAVG